MNELEKKMLTIFKQEVKEEQNEYENVNEYTKFIYNNRKFILDLLEKQQKEIDKQNKVIDEMAKYMEDGRGMEEICNKKDCYADEYINGHCQKCLNCIKQYFIRKVKEDVQ